MSARKPLPCVRSVRSQSGVAGAVERREAGDELELAVVVEVDDQRRERERVVGRVPLQRAGLAVEHRGRDDHLGLPVALEVVDADAERRALVREVPEVERHLPLAPCPCGRTRRGRRAARRSGTDRAASRVATISGRPSPSMSPTAGVSSVDGGLGLEVLRCRWRRRARGCARRSGKNLPVQQIGRLEARDHDHVRRVAEVDRAVAVVVGQVRDERRAVAVAELGRPLQLRARSCPAARSARRPAARRLGVGSSPCTSASGLVATGGGFIGAAHRRVGEAARGGGRRHGGGGCRTPRSPVPRSVVSAEHAASSARPTQLHGRMSMPPHAEPPLPEGSHRSAHGHSTAYERSGASEQGLAHGKTTIPV